MKDDTGFTPLSHIMYREKSTFQEILESVYRDTSTVMLSDRNGNIIYYFPIHRQTYPDIDVSILMAKGWNHEILAGQMVEFNTLSENYWACECKKGWCKHKAEFLCLKCGATVETTKNGMPYIEDIMKKNFKWEFTVED